MRSLALAAILSLAIVPAAFAKGPCRDAHGKFMSCPPAAARHCSKGKPSGNSCVAKDKVCHK